MSDVLDQSEVDALLAAVDAGQVAEEDPEVGSGPGRADAPVRVYDFKRPERVSKDQIRALEAIHEGFARNFGAALSGFLRTIIEVRVASVEQLTYSEFIHSLPNPTCFNLLRATPLEGQMCLEISPLIIYPIIDRLLGGSNAELFIPQRPLTNIELRLVRRITDRALSNLSEVWSSLVECKFELTETESNPHLVQIVAPNEVVVVIGFELKTGTRAGTMSLCVPFNVIEPVMGKLATQGWLAYQRRASDQGDVRRITTSLKTAKVNLRALLATTKITMHELMRLRPGDLILTQRLAKEDVLLQVEGKHKFWGHVGQYRGKRAICIHRPTSKDETALSDFD